MKGWDIDYDAIVVEEILDTDPDLYGRRALAAIEEERYYDAIQEAQTALKYSNGDIQYHFLVIKASYKMGMYGMCYNYILNTHILEYVYETPWHEFWTSAIDVDELMEIYMHCWRSMGHILQDARVIVVYANDKGMADTLQDAVNVCLPNQYIYVMEETHRTETVHIPFDCEGCTVERGKVRITGKSVRMQIIVNGGMLEISEMDLYSKENTFVIKMCGGSILLKDVTIHGNTSHSNGKITYGKDIGLYVANDANIIADGCILKNLQVGIYVEAGKISIKASSFEGGGNGIVAIGENKRIVLGIEDAKFRCYRSAISVGYNVDMNIYRSEIEWDGEINIDGSIKDNSHKNKVCIHNSKIRVIVVHSGGEVKLTNSQIDKIVMKEAKILCEECKPIGSKVLLHKVMDDNIVITGKMECSERNTIHFPAYTGATVESIVWDIRWILDWGSYPMAEYVKYVVRSYETDRDKLNTKMKQRADMLMKQLREAVVSNNIDKATKVKSELLDILFTV